MKLIISFFGTKKIPSENKGKWMIPNEKEKWKIISVFLSNWFTNVICVDVN